MADTIAPAKSTNRSILRKPKGNKEGNESKEKQTLALRLRSGFDRLTRSRDDRLSEQQKSPPYIQDIGASSTTSVEEGDCPIKPVQSIARCQKCGRDETVYNQDHYTDPSVAAFCCTICRSSLLSLPLELLQQVASYLDNASLWLLRLSCSRIYSSIPPTSNPRHEGDWVIFMLQIRSLIPSHLEYCPECNIYHAWTESIWFWWDANEKRCRRSAKADGVPSFRGGTLGADMYVCATCNTRRPYRHCALCMRCEACVGPDEASRFLEKHGRGLPFYCKVCNGKKIRCCGRPILARRACHGCERCEDCTGCRFRYGQTRCGLCGGDPGFVQSTRSAVDYGPGYEFFYGGGDGSVGRPSRVGSR